MKSFSIQVLPLPAAKDLVLKVSYGGDSYTQKIDSNKSVDLFVESIEKAVNGLLNKANKLQSKK